MAEEKQAEKWGFYVGEPGMAGLNTLQYQRFVADGEMTQALNVNYDGGLIGPRLGSTVSMPKPTYANSGTVGTALNLFTPVDSAGNSYLLAAYFGTYSTFGPSVNFYIWDSTNSRFILINNTVLSASNVPFQYDSWTGGVGSDYMYLSNGVDFTGKWVMSLGNFGFAAIGQQQVKVSVASAQAFQNSGGSPGAQVVLVDLSGNYFYNNIQSVNTTTGYITLVNALTENFTGGTIVSLMNTAPTGTPIAKLVAVSQSRVFYANETNNNSIVQYSKLNAPDNFTDIAGIAGAGTFTLADGDGPINALIDFGTYIALGKRDSWSQVLFQLDAALDAKYVSVTPLAKGYCIGPFTVGNTLRTYNNVYYPTLSEGIYAMSPGTSGNTVSVSINDEDSKINDQVTANFSFLNGRSILVGQKQYFACYNNTFTAGVNPNTISGSNNLVLVYDQLYEAWTFYNNWFVKDFANYLGSLYYLDSLTGNVVLCLTGLVDQGTPYETSFTTKEYDFGIQTLPKTATKFFIDGFISNNTTLYVDVYYNVAGALGQTTYAISGSSQNVVTVSNNPLGGAQPLGGPVTLGSGTFQESMGYQNLSYFIVYLDLNAAYGFFTLQLQFYTNTGSQNYAIIGFGADPAAEMGHPPELTISPSDTPLTNTTVE